MHYWDQSHFTKPPTTGEIFFGLLGQQRQAGCERGEPHTNDGGSAPRSDSFPVPTNLFFKGDERLGRNDVKVAGQAGKGGLPLMQCVLVKTASGATGNESAPRSLRACLLSPEKREENNACYAGYHHSWPNIEGGILWKKQTRLAHRQEGKASSVKKTERVLNGTRDKLKKTLGKVLSLDCIY